MNLREASVILSEPEGHDSIPTIEWGYRKSEWSTTEFRMVETDTFGCPFPTCDYRTKNSERMWAHVHITGPHGRSFEVRSRRDAIALAEWLAAGGGS